MTIVDTLEKIVIDFFSGHAYYHLWYMYVLPLMIAGSTLETIQYIALHNAIGIRYLLMQLLTTFFRPFLFNVM